jgi:hypothetical protein
MQHGSTTGHAGIAATAGAHEWEQRAALEEAGDAAPSSFVRRAASERRRALRVPCALEIVDAEHRAYLIEDVGPSGIRFAGGREPAAGPVSMRLPVPGQARGIELMARPVWAKRGHDGRWEVGARIDGANGQMRRFQFMVAALAEGRPVADLGWVPFQLLERAQSAEAEIARIRSLPIEGAAARAARRCAAIAPRPWFLWQWARDAIESTTLASVAPAWRERVEHLKLCAAILFTAVDDVADELRDPALFALILAHVFGRRAAAPEPRGSAREAVRSLSAQWRHLNAGMRALPRYRELAGLFDFDCGTFLHGVEHALLVGAMPEAHCPEEVWTAAFMPMFADLDLMCSPGFARAELGGLRGVVLEAQQMVILANALGTWEREVRAGDHTSPVVGAALRRGVLLASELGDGTPAEELVERIRATEVEAALMLRWELHWRSLAERRRGLATVDIGSYLRGLERVFELQMASRGLV